MYKLLIILFLALPFSIYAQNSVATGGVYDFSKKTISLPGVTIRNLNTKKLSSTNNAGKYTIQASVGDLLEFSLVGYQTYTVYLTTLLSKAVYLSVKSNSLSDVDVNGVRINKQVSQAKDPLAENYNQFYTGGKLERKRMTDKVGGLTLNLGHGKYKKQQQKEAALEARDQYLSEIDQNFTEKAITDLTKLQGAELKNFMIIYRPTVEKVQSERPFRYTYYIGQSYQAWQKLSPQQKKLQDLPALKN